MTNRELIEHLQTLPLDALVVYTMYSECTLLDKEEVTVQQMVPCGSVAGLGNMCFMHVEPGTPGAITTVGFPGN